MRDELFESEVRSAGDVAGVFELDGEAGYFYLFEMSRDFGQRVVAAIPVLNGEPDFEQKDIAIRWDEDERRVGLLIRDQLWAAFDVQSKASYGGNYTRGATPRVPREIADAFNSRGDSLSDGEKPPPE
jgi:hypothetical protein